jgi:serine-type D-Ala-D-Ala carboxypeptidase (penicillin-binding protein 5/6)
VKLAHREEHVDVVATASVRRIIRRGQRFRVQVQGVPTELDGPLPGGSRVGTAVVRLGDEVVARVPLVTSAAIAEASFGDRVSEASDGLVVPLAVGLALVGSLLIMILRRRAVRRRRRVRRRERRAA